MRPGFVNINPMYLILTILILSIPITLPTLYFLYTRYKTRGIKKEVKREQTEKEKKREERQRRKEIKRAKKFKGKT